MYGKDGLIEEKNTKNSLTRVDIDKFRKLALRAV
jgi:hypothetical protein